MCYRYRYHSCSHAGTEINGNISSILVVDPRGEWIPKALPTTNFLIIISVIVSVILMILDDSGLRRSCQPRRRDHGSGACWKYLVGRVSQSHTAQYNNLKVLSLSPRLGNKS